MSNYSNNPASVRVDFFRSSGKWYTTEAVEFARYDGPIHEAFEAALVAHLGRGDDGASPRGPFGVRRVRLSGMWAVCLDPYHEHGHPLMMRVPGGGEG